MQAENVRSPDIFRLTSGVGVPDTPGMRVETIIERGGGASKLAQRLGVSRPTVLGWRAAGAIPGHRVAQISKALGIRADDLLPLVQEPRQREPAP